MASQLLGGKTTADINKDIRIVIIKNNNLLFCRYLRILTSNFDRLNFFLLFFLARKKTIIDKRVIINKCVKRTVLELILKKILRNSVVMRISRNNKTIACTKFSANEFLSLKKWSNTCITIKSKTKIIIISIAEGAGLEPAVPEGVSFRG